MVNTRIVQRERIEDLREMSTDQLQQLFIDYTYELDDVTYELQNEFKRFMGGNSSDPSWLYGKNHKKRTCKSNLDSIVYVLSCSNDPSICKCNTLEDREAEVKKRRHEINLSLKQIKDIRKSIKAEHKKQAVASGDTENSFAYGMLGDICDDLCLNSVSQARNRVLNMKRKVDLMDDLKATYGSNLKDILAKNKRSTDREEILSGIVELFGSSNKAHILERVKKVIRTSNTHKVNLDMQRIFVSEIRSYLISEHGKEWWTNFATEKGDVARAKYAEMHPEGEE